MSMMRTLAAALLILSVAGAACAEGPANAQAPDEVVTSATVRAGNVVLVHGGTTDGSGWKDVFEILRAKGLTVTVVQLPHTSLQDDIAAVKLAVVSGSPRRASHRWKH